MQLYRPIRHFLQGLIDVPLEKNIMIAGKYEVISRLGSGSYGITYLCRDHLIGNGSYIALKQLRKSKRIFNKERLAFIQEYELLNELEHHAIPKVNPPFYSEGSCFFSMQYMDGKNIEEIIFGEQRTFTEKKALLLLLDITEIVSYLHRQRIYHGDIRIPNIMLNGTNASLIDFGLAKAFDGGYSQQEQKRKEQDFFDLGDILLFLLYTTFESDKKRALPWTEELQLSAPTSQLIKRLLGIAQPYAFSEEILHDIRHAVKAL